MLGRDVRMACTSDRRYSWPTDPSSDRPSISPLMHTVKLTSVGPGTGCTHKTVMYGPVMAGTGCQHVNTVKLTSASSSKECAYDMPRSLASHKSSRVVLTELRSQRDFLCRFTPVDARDKVLQCRVFFGFTRGRVVLRHGGARGLERFQRRSGWRAPAHSGTVRETDLNPQSCRNAVPCAFFCSVTQWTA